MEGRTSGNSPLCSTGHCALGAAAQKGWIHGIPSHAQVGKNNDNSRNSIAQSAFPDTPRDAMVKAAAATEAQKTYDSTLDKFLS